ncbi:secondary thiamine-phosphate synthase enzyme YjbQ [Methanocella sp. MCL-LM]|uniref:secondary thiamine-phosphate synthase enzyme YjbQ n=1 Tax=Methanocella sp. MCL-LM TaxID=3412035 RepID=UPI003C747FCA
MPVLTRTLTVETRGHDDMINLTDQVGQVVASGDIKEGIVTVFVPGSTASITTIEYEPGLQQDLPRALERLAPSDASYEHDLKWGDGNGMSHVRAATMGPDIVVPFKEKSLLLGTWQQIVIVDFDVRPRRREVIVQVLGF